MTKLQQSERAEAIAQLRETLKPGTTVYTILRHVSRSGMSRDIDVYVMEDGEPRRITWSVAKAADLTYSRKAEAIKIGGCGMDMGFAIVYDLSRSLYDRGHTFTCIGKDCPSNDHSNAYCNSRQNQCLVCRHELPDGRCKHCSSYGKIGEECPNCEPSDDLGPMVFQPEFTRMNLERHEYAVCSEQCAERTWVHSDGGYALKHRWM